MNFLPAERPRSIDSQACGLVKGSSGEETLNEGTGWLVTTSGGCKLLDGALLPLPSIA